MLDSTGGVRLVRACTAMEPNATLSVPVVQCTGRSRFPLPPRSIANKKRKSRGFCVGVVVSSTCVTSGLTRNNSKTGYSFPSCDVE